MADIEITNSTPTPSPAGPFQKHDVVTIHNNGPVKIRLKDFVPSTPPIFSESGYTIEVGETISPKVIADIPRGQKVPYSYKCPPDLMTSGLTDGGGIIIVDGGGPTPGPKGKGSGKKPGAAKKGSTTKSKVKSAGKTKPKAKPKSKGKAKGGKKATPKRKGGSKKK